MVGDRSTDGAWQLARPKTRTGRYAKAIVAHRFEGKLGRATAQWDGAIDGKAMHELMVLGVREGLIVLGDDKKARNVDRFLAELRPFQLDVSKEGADALRALMAEAGVRREFFEISAQWGGRTWSDAGANQMLRDKLLGHVPPPPHYSDVTPEIVGEGRDSSQLGDITAFRAGLGPESQG
jgi:hypothetical protein